MKAKIFLLAFISFLSVNISYAQWEPDFRLTNDPAYSNTSYNGAWCIAAYGNKVHTVWYDYRNGNPEIYYKSSTDNGVTWGMDTRLTNDTAYSRSPAIAVSGQNLHIVWYDYRNGNYEIYYKRSTDGGMNWESDIRLTNDSSESSYPSVAVSGSLVNVVWHDKRDGNFEIYYKRSSDGGINWGTDTRVSNNSSFSYYPSVAVSGLIVNVVWEEWRDLGNGEIYYKRSTDGGVSWGSEIRLTNNTSYSREPSIAFSGSFIHLVWCDERDGNQEIYYKRSTDNGISWGVDTRLTNNTSSSCYSSVAVIGTNVHIVWQDRRDGNNEIYYKRSTDGGLSWEADTRLTNNSHTSWYSSLAVADTSVHVIWNDNRDGNYEIYYKRNPTGNTITGMQNISTEVPLVFSLEQNYPNPFNPSSNIKFAIPREVFVSMKVYDVMGKVVKLLVNETKPAGNYSVDFNGSNLSSGVYFYKIQAGDFVQTRKMIILK